MLEEREIIDSINYRDSGHIEVRKAFIVLRDGVEIARQYHRHVVDPDKEDLSGEDDKVKAVAHALAGHRSAKAKEAKEKAMTGDPEQFPPTEPEPVAPPEPEPEEEDEEVTEEEAPDEEEPDPNIPA